MFSPFAGITYPALDYPSTAYCLVMFCDAVFAPYLLFSSHSSSPLDTETDAAATQYDYGVDDHSFLPEGPGKHPPPLITRYRLFFSLLLALE